MVRTLLPLKMLLLSILVIALAACVSVDREDSDIAEDPRSTPEATETEIAETDSAPDETPVAEPDPTLEPAETPEAEATPDPAATPVADATPAPDPTPDTDVADPEEWYTLLVTEKTYPEAEIGEQILELAENETDFQQTWNWFGFDEPEAPDVDWDNRLVLFAGTGESSGCPLALDSVDFDQEHRLIGVGASRDVPEDTVCTMDWTPRVFVIALDRDHLGDGELRAVIYDTEFEDEADPERGVQITGK